MQARTLTTVMARCPRVGLRPREDDLPVPATRCRGHAAHRWPSGRSRWRRDGHRHGGHPPRRPAASGAGPRRDTPRAGARPGVRRCARPGWTSERPRARPRRAWEPRMPPFRHRSCQRRDGWTRLRRRRAHSHMCTRPCGTVRSRAPCPSSAHAEVRTSRSTHPHPLLESASPTSLHTLVSRSGQSTTRPPGWCQTSAAARSVAITHDTTAGGGRMSAPTGATLVKSVDVNRCKPIKGDRPDQV